MRKKTIRIPIYECDLTIILDKDLYYVENKYKTKSLSNFGAVTLKDESKYRHYVIGFTDATHLSNIAHEIVHLKNSIYIDCAMDVNRYDDEPEAYLTGWLFDQINDFLNGKNQQTTIDKQFLILKDTLEEMLTTFDTEEDKNDFILDVCNGYKSRLTKQ